MNSKLIILNTIMADLSYSIENVERLVEIDQKQIEIAIGILRANRIKLMAMLEEQLEATK